jgi:hypothetical protein
VYKELKEKWGWNEAPSAQQFSQTHTGAKEARELQEVQSRQRQEQAQAAQHMHLQQGFPSVTPATFTSQQNMQHNIQQAGLTQAPQAQPLQLTPQSQQPTPQKKMPAGIPNPMYAKADFSLPQHPYQTHYVPPNMFATQQAGGMYYSF